MGCGLSRNQAGVYVKSHGLQANASINSALFTPGDELRIGDSEPVPKEQKIPLPAGEGTPSLVRTASLAERLDHIAAERAADRVVDEDLFVYGDFVVPQLTPNLPQRVAEISGDSEDKTRVVPKKIRRKRMNPRQLRDIDLLNRQESRKIFEFGDFCVHFGDTRKLSGEIKDYELYTLPGHASRVKCVTPFFDSLCYVSCSITNPTVVMNNFLTGEQLRTFTGHCDTISMVCVSPGDCKHLLTASRDCTMVLWDSLTGNQLHVFEHQMIVICCCFSPDGLQAISGCQDQTCRVWELASGRQIVDFRDHSGVITCVAYSSSGLLVVSSSSDKVIKTWAPLPPATCKLSLMGHNKIPLQCTFSRDGDYIVSNDQDAIFVWDAHKGTRLHHIRVEDIKPAPNVLIDQHQFRWTFCMYCPPPFHDYIIAACSDHTVRIFEPRTGKQLLDLYCRTSVYCAAGCPDVLGDGTSARILFGDTFGNIYVLVLKGTIQANPVAGTASRKKTR